MNSLSASIKKLVDDFNKFLERKPASIRFLDSQIWESPITGEISVCGVGHGGNCEYLVAKEGDIVLVPSSKIREDSHEMALIGGYVSLYSSVKINVVKGTKYQIKISDSWNYGEPFDKGYSYLNEHIIGQYRDNYFVSKSDYQNGNPDSCGDVTILQQINAATQYSTFYSSPSLNIPEGNKFKGTGLPGWGFDLEGINLGENKSDDQYNGYSKIQIKKIKRRATSAQSGRIEIQYKFCPNVEFNDVPL